MFLEKHYPLKLDQSGFCKSAEDTMNYTHAKLDQNQIKLDL